jgi:Tfp pilus assembly protein PilE
MARSKGFGLLDLMVTFVVTSMLATLAVPAKGGLVLGEDY